MSTVLHGQLISWRGTDRPRARVPLAGIARAVVVVLAVAAAVAYMATMSETPALVAALIGEAAPRREAPRAQRDDPPPAVVVATRPAVRGVLPVVP